MNKHLLEKARKYEAERDKLIAQSERPVYHVTAVSGWINDPNGFSEYKNEYHLFYQNHPYSNEWGNIHWGHVKSKDFITWERVPIAIAPDEIYDKQGCFSGSALELEDGKQVLIYTGVEEKETTEGEKILVQAQCIAFGDGIDYEKSSNNPVISEADLPKGADPLEFRDPKIWKDDGKYYVVSVNKIDNGAVFLHESTDLIHWKYCGILDSSRGELGNMWECPDFFSLDGKQILMVSPMAMKANGEDFHVGNGTLCCIGEYDKSAYKFNREKYHIIDCGIDFYAPQTMETKDNRRIMIAWMQAWSTSMFVPDGAKYFGQMTIPRELSLRNGRVYQNPVRELDMYRRNKVTYSDVEVNKEMILDQIDGRVIDMTIEVQNLTEFHEFTMSVACDDEYETIIQYNTDNNKLNVDRTNSGFLHDIVHSRNINVNPQNGKVKLRFILDRFSMEIFINDGEKAASFTIYTPQTAKGIIFNSDGNAIINIEKYDLIKE